MPTRQRLSTSPEKLILANLIYTIESKSARTFFIIGDVIVWSHHPHLQIINALRTLKNSTDHKTLKKYDVKIIGNLTQQALDHFRNRLTGTLGQNRRRNKAGRIWLNIPDHDGTNTSVISFWAKRNSISQSDITLLQLAFQIKSPFWSDYIDRARSTSHILSPPPNPL